MGSFGDSGGLWRDYFLAGAVLRPATGGKVDRKRTSSVASQLNKKETLIVSATTVMRQRPPTNDFLTSKNPSMVWDYSQQRRVWPNGNPNALIEATQQTGTKYDTINKSGRPFALGNMEIGGDAQETNGDPLFEKATRKKMLK
jgi:hypothetical protein